jgi:hypothetical protein
MTGAMENGAQRRTEARKGRRGGERKVGWLWEIGIKELREYRKVFLISRIKVSNEIRSNSNEFYSTPNSRAYINTNK